MDAARIDERLNIVAGRLNAAHAELVDIAVAVLADSRLWSEWECHTPERYLAWRTGAQRSVIDKVVAIAARADDLPHCLAAFREGLLSLDQLAPIARKVPWWADEEICRQAQMMTVKQISRTASRYTWTHGIPKPDGSLDGLSRPRTTIDTEPDAGAGDTPDGGPVDATEACPVPSDRLSIWWDDDDRLRLSGEFDRSTGSVIETALEEARDSLFQAGDPSVDWPAALLEVAERSLDTVSEPARQSRFKTIVHVEANQRGVRRTTNATGHEIGERAAAYMTCDGVRSEVVEVDGLPVSVGRTQRVVPVRTRQLIVHRDGGCRVPGCTDERWLDVHHIVHWAHGGATDTHNLVALCGRHHRAHHRGHLGVSGDADAIDGIHFTDRHGRRIAPSGARPEPPGHSSATEPVANYRPALREPLHSRWQHFNLPIGHRHLVGHIAPPS